MKALSHELWAFALSKGLESMEHISKPANRVLDYIAKKRVGRTLETLELAGCDDKLKSAVKKQLWEFKNEVEEMLDNGECKDDDK